MIYVFGNCELDVQLYTLNRSGDSIRLSPKIFQVLVYLLEHHDRVVSKQELAEQVWPDQFISDATLESAMREVRKAVGDSGREQRMIRTQRGHGYRCIAEVSLRESGNRGTEVSIPSALTSSEPPFVGRHQELAFLHELWKCTEQGRGQIAILQGAPGMGKSRLLSEFRTQLQGRSLVYLPGACSTYEYPIPYQPIRDIVSQCCGIAHLDCPERVRSKLRQQLADLELGDEAHVEYLAHLFGLPSSISQQRPQTNHLRTVALWRRFILAHSTRQPLLLLIEAVDRIDTASIACLRSLIESVSAAAILLVATSQAETLPPWLDKQNPTSLTLGPLTPEVVPPLARSSENLNMQLNRLPLQARQLLQYAAVIGPSFSLAVLQAVWPGTADYQSLLLNLEVDGWCRTLPEPHASTYRFNHSLIWQAAYASLTSSHRKQLHATIGQALEAMHQTPGIDAVTCLAYHFEQAQHTVKAISYLTQYAEHAAQQYAHTEAIQALQAAVDLVPYLPDDVQEYRYLDLVQRLSRSRLALEQTQELLAVLRAQQSRVSHLQDTLLTASHDLLMSQALSRLGNWEQAADYAHQARQAASLSQNHALMGQAYHLLTMAHYHASQPVLGVRCGRQAVTLLKHSKDRYRLGRAHFVLGLHHLILGGFEAAQDSANQLRVIGEAIDEPHLRVLAHWSSGWLQATRGEWEAGITACQQGIQAAVDPLSCAIAQGGLGYAYLEKGEVAEAIPQLEQARQRLRQLGYLRFAGWYTILAGEAYCIDGQLDTAWKLIEKGVDAARNHHDHFGIGWGQRTLGRIAQAKDQLAESQKHWQEALATFTALQARFEMGRTHLMWAGLASQQGEQQILESHLTEAHHLFRALQVPIYLKRTQQWASAIAL